jgi:hypothetical protein
MATNAYFQHPETKKVQKVKIGIHWVIPIASFFRGAASFSTLLLYMIWPFGIYKRIISNLITKGYKLKSLDGGKPIEFLEQKVGFTLPRTQE